jgi:hypothetical protein
MRLWSARTRPRFDPTRHVASRESGDVSPQSKSDVMPSHSTPNAPIVHFKMNTGKEAFKCGMESAECGVRPNLISVIAKHRAPRPVK